MKAQYKSTLLFAIFYAFSAFSILIYSALHRGPWLDEFWSLWVSDGTISFESILKTRWLVDVHPPMFAAFMYAASKLIPLNIISGRLFNLIPLLLSAAFLTYVFVADRRMRQFLFLFSLTIASSYHFTWYFPEFRSYFLGICAFSVMVVLLRQFCEDTNTFHKTSGNGAWAAFFVSVFICLNIHYITALFSSIVLATFGIYFLSKRRIDYFLKFIAIGVLSVIPLLAFAITQFTFLKMTSSTFWIDTSTLEGGAIIFEAITKALVPQFVLSLLVLRLIAHNWRNGRFSDLNEKGILKFSLLLAVSVALFVSSIVAINLKSPIIQERYVIPLAISCLAIISNICELVDFDRTLVQMAFIANCILLTLFFGVRTSSQDRWYASAHIVKQHLDSCPSSRVIARVWNPSGVKNEEYVMKLGYEYTSKIFQIPVEHLESVGVSNASRACPDIIWIENVKNLLSLDPKDIKDQFTSRNADYRGYDISIAFDDPQKEALVLLAKSRAAGS